MGFTFVGRSPKVQPVAPGPRQNSVSPVKTVLVAAECRQVLRGESRRVQRTSVVPAMVARVPQRGAGLAPAGRVGGDVVVVPLGEHDRRHAAVAVTIGAGLVRCVDPDHPVVVPTSQTLFSTSNS